MNIVLDLGNTDVKAALFQDSNLLDSKRVDYSNSEEIISFITKNDIEYLGISSVRTIPEEIKELITALNIRVIHLDIQIHRLPLKVNYKTPETLGHDRICNAMAAFTQYKSENVLIIDLGTCNKYDFIDEEGVYHGGSISPGFKMRLDAMHKFTDQLPLLKPESTDQLIGDSTNNSMLTGAFNGTIGEINHIIEQYNSKFSDLRVVLTGGFASFFEKGLKNHIFADPYMTLKGMNEILHIQVNR